MKFHHEEGEGFQQTVFSFSKEDWDQNLGAWTAKSLAFWHNTFNRGQLSWHTRVTESSWEVIADGIWSDGAVESVLVDRDARMIRNTRKEEVILSPLLNFVEQVEIIRPGRPTTIFS